MMLAHDETGLAQGLFAGLLHPVTGLDHVVAMVAVGLWGAQLGKPAIYLLPIAFPVVMALGGFLGLVGIPLPGVELGIALSAVVLGICVLSAWKPPLPVAMAIVSVFAIFHGHAHGTELPEDSSGITYSAGFVVATGCLHATGIGIGEARRVRDGERLLRGVGGVVAVAGVWFLLGALGVIA
jgi:urease accessory protein